YFTCLFALIDVVIMSCINTFSFLLETAFIVYLFLLAECAIKEHIPKYKTKNKQKIRIK
ncbi:hypothetical protein AAUPMC_09176, partial [Pasteurella multocida subsp. multocida str. Anand1_cattle]